MKVLGVMFIIAGIGLGLYVGLWVMFVGGIVTVVEAVKVSPVDSYGIAWGILKVCLSGIVGWVVFFFCSLIGSVFFMGD